MITSTAHDIQRALIRTYLSIKVRVYDPRMSISIHKTIGVLPAPYITAPTEAEDRSLFRLPKNHTMTEQLSAILKALLSLPRLYTISKCYAACPSVEFCICVKK